MLSAFTDRDYPFGDSCHNEVGHITCIQLVHQMTAVRINRIGRDTKFLSYFLRVLALGYPFQYIKFAQGQFPSRRPSSERRICARTCSA